MSEQSLRTEYKSCSSFLGLSPLSVSRSRGCVPLFPTSTETSDGREILRLPYGVDRCEEHIKHFHNWFLGGVSSPIHQEALRLGVRWEHPQSVPFHSDGVFSSFFLLMESLPRTAAWMSVYGIPGIEKWECFNKQANKMGCFVRGCWILQPNNAALRKILHSVSAPFQGQLCWCSPPPPFFNKRIYSIILEE